MANEWLRRTARGVPPGQSHPELETERREIAANYMSQDTNKDGYLSLNELVKEPLANFDCIDADHDGKISKSEESSLIDRCAPPVEDKASKP